MGLRELNKIDAIGQTPTGEVIIKIFDDMDWSNEYEHLILLQEKLNNYIEFVVSGQVNNHFKKHKGIIFSVDYMEKIPENAIKLMEYFSGFLADIPDTNITIEWEDEC
ncbi:hypothetical protein LJB88_00040 [Erysipelotrichaceae bacterium OttesenSCG-928-M19]|nr:hypothetical protein [Erysipelotrichaceae bacterium OttesenSCG-928-M19]